MTPTPDARSLAAELRRLRQNELDTARDGSVSGYPRLALLRYVIDNFDALIAALEAAPAGVEWGAHDELNLQWCERNADEDSRYGAALAKLRAFVTARGGE